MRLWKAGKARRLRGVVSFTRPLFFEIRYNGPCQRKRPRFYLKAVRKGWQTQKYLPPNRKRRELAQLLLQRSEIRFLPFQLLARGQKSTVAK